MNKFLLLIVLLFAFAGCTTKTPKIKSPCVSNNFSAKPGPCLKRPANTWLA